MTTIEAPRTVSPEQATSRPPRTNGRIHVVGAGPVGLFLTAILQSFEDQEVRLYEKRDAYTRSRMVSLAPYLVADSIDGYRHDPLDDANVDAIFDRGELEKAMAYRRTLPPDLWSLLEEWTRGFVPLNTIEQSLSDLIASRDAANVERVPLAVDAEAALAMLEPDDVLVDCTGARSLLRDALRPGDDLGTADRNTSKMRLEYAVTISFLYDRNYECNEYCKYYKNVDNADYKFIPSVRRTHYDGSVTHVTGIVRISEDEFHEMPPKCDGALLRAEFPGVARSMDNFIDKIKAETHGEIIGDLQIVCIPLDLYRAQHFTTKAWRASGIDHPLARTPVFLLGDSALGSPYFQSISLGLEAAFAITRQLTNPTTCIDDVLTHYEDFMYRQWLRVYIRTQTIKHNKDLLESIGDDFALLEKMHVF